MHRAITAIGIAFLLAGLITIRPQSRSAPMSSLATESPGDIIFVMAARVLSASAALTFPDGSKIVRRSQGNPGGPVTLTSEFFAAADPQISFDGARILFAARKTRDSFWQIWEMSTDGSAKRQITACRADCSRPAYLPVGDIVYTVTTEQDGRRKSAVVVSAIDGSQERVITSGPGNYQLETVLADGRLLVSAAWPLLSNAEASNSRSLYTLRPDGTGLELLRANLVPEGVPEGGQELDDGSVVFIKASSSADLGGRVAVLQSGAPHAAALRSDTRACRSLRQFSRDALIVSCSSSSDSGAASKFNLYLLDLAGGTFTPIFSDPQQSALQALPLVPRRKPRILWSTLRSDAKAGYFVALDSSRSADFRGGRVPGKIACVRVFSLDQGTGHQVLLGEAPVEQDGSFYIAVPVDQPVRFELVSDAGSILAAQKSWIWSQPGEQRACLGCHEDKAITPENRWPLALKRFDSPIQLGVKDVAPIAPE